ncbi:hypothetical protein RF11_08725 [Thelohanellus kitauei]|uniref:Uncharacterized protein n=1 Tax=Thelohanellus kitauei TaxID=669202 RepID=A0A0C2MWS5_THEKT|nr:hypothetical protein RF11_01436 [Thelohanellus kitauei]KII68595.1 hypothetical protein RF11_08725 [Thelohanellus kitauei]
MPEGTKPDYNHKDHIRLIQSMDFSPQVPEYCRQQWPSSDPYHKNYQRSKRNLFLSSSRDRFGYNEILSEETHTSDDSSVDSRSLSVNSNTYLHYRTQQYRKTRKNKLNRRSQRSRRDSSNPYVHDQAIYSNIRDDYRKDQLRATKNMDPPPKRKHSRIHGAISHRNEVDADDESTIMFADLMDQNTLGEDSLPALFNDLEKTIFGNTDSQISRSDVLGSSALTIVGLSQSVVDHARRNHDLYEKAINILKEIVFEIKN